MGESISICSVYFSGRYLRWVGLQQAPTPSARCFVSKTFQKHNDPRQVVTTYTVSGASGAYKFALPAKDHEHLAFLSVTMGKKDLGFELEASSASASKSAGLVLYSAAVGQPEDGSKITVGEPLRARACVCSGHEHRLRLYPARQRKRRHAFMDGIARSVCVCV